MYHKDVFLFCFYGLNFPNKRNGILQFGLYRGLHVILELYYFGSSDGSNGFFIFVIIF